MSRLGDPSETVGERLERILQEEGVSKAELARRLSATYGRTPDSWRRQIVKWANGTIPDTVSAHRLARALQVPEDTFVTSRETQSLLRVLTEGLTAVQAQLTEFQTSVEARLAALEAEQPRRSRQ